MFFVLLSLVILLKCMSYIWEKRKLIKLYMKLKNDIKAYPIIGHGYLAIGSDEDRMTGFQRLGKEAIKHGGITRIYVLHRIFVVIADAEIAQFILKNCLEKADITKVITNLIGNGSIFAPVPIWRPRRKILATAFAPKYLNQFVEIFNKKTQALADNLEDKVDQGPFSLWKYTPSFTMETVCETTLDLQVGDNQNQPFLQAFNEYCRITSQRLCSPWLYNDTIFYSIPWYKKIKDHIKYMQDFVNEIIRAKRKAIKLEQENMTNNHNSTSPRRVTMLDLLISPSSYSDGYTDLELREELLMIVIGGSDTSAITTGFIMMMLAIHQDVQNNVFDEVTSILGSSSRSVTPEDMSKMKYLEAVIQETLRLYTPVPVIVRKVDEDITLPTGLEIPRDTDILLNLFSLNRNPLYWGEDAEEFKPTRFLSKQPRHPAAMVAFSHGPRNCIGYQYVMMLLKVVISTLIRRYHILPAQESTQLRFKYTTMMKEINDFPICLKRRVIDNL